MLLTPLCSALALAACLLLALPAWGAEEEPASAAPAADASAAAGEAAQAEAKALMDAGRFMEALALLRPLLGQEAIEANVLFRYGLAAIGASQHPDVADDVREALLDEAIGAFHVMLVRAPGLVRVRLELARAFFLKGENDLARRHFEQVLVGDVPPPVAANVRAFLNQIRARKRWSFTLGAAIAPDSNIGAGSDERIIHVFGLPFRRDQEELTSSGVGVSVWGGAEYQVPVAERLRLRAGGNVSRREYGGSQFDQLFLATHLGPRWFVDRDTEASLLASARQRWLGTVKDNHGLGARVEVAHRVSPAVTVSGQASWHGQRYRTRTALDGPVWDALLRGIWVVTPTVRADVSTGYARERPSLIRERSRSRWLGAGVSVILPLGFTVGGGGEMRWTNYESGWFPFVPDNGARKDRTRSLRASVHNRAVTVLGFSPELVLVKEERSSNAQLHDYERTRGELRFVRQF